jgi:hypothetical protein
MKKTLLALVGAGLLAVSVMAADAPFNEDIPDRYTVVKGDTLWDISNMFLQDPWLWPEIWFVNPQISNPHLIYPGDIIKLVYIDGKPRLTVERGRTVKLEPEAKVIPHEEAIPTLPLDVIDNFLSRTRVVQPGQLELAPYVIAGHEKRILTGKGDDFYVRGELSPNVDFYGIYRKGDPYVDPETDELLGIRAQDVGSAQLKSTDGEIATFAATRSVEEIRIGDRLLPHEERRLETTFYPSPPGDDVEGLIIAVDGGVTQVGHLDVVAINRGKRDGLVIGNMLAIYKAGEQVRDRIKGDMVTLPAERAGLLMVFRTYDKMSFGLVMHAERPLAVGDQIRNP